MNCLLFCYVVVLGTIFGSLFFLFLVFPFNHLAKIDLIHDFESFIWRRSMLSCPLLVYYYYYKISVSRHSKQQSLFIYIPSTTFSFSIEVVARTKIMFKGFDL